MNDSAFCKDCYGEIERVWPWSGLVSFPLCGRIEQAYFHRESVLIDNCEISPSLNIMDILRGGMAASLRVIPSHTGTDIRFIAICVNVSSFESFNSMYNSETEILNEAHYSESFNMASGTQIAPPNDSDIYFDHSDTVINVTPINQNTNEDHQNKIEDHQNKIEDHQNKNEDHQNKNEDHQNKIEDHQNKNEDHQNKIEDHQNKNEDHQNKNEDHQNKNEDYQNKAEDHQNKSEDLPRPTALPHKESNETIKVVTPRQEQQRINLQSKDQINNSFARKKRKKRKKFNSKLKTFHSKPHFAPHTLRLNKDLNNRIKAKTFQQRKKISLPKYNLSRPMISQIEPDLTPEQWLEEFF